MEKSVSGKTIEIEKPAENYDKLLKQNELQKRTINAFKDQVAKLRLNINY